MNGEADEPSELEPADAHGGSTETGNNSDDGAVRDELPEDLNATEYVGPYVFPNNNRRRIAATLRCASDLTSARAGPAKNESHQQQQQNQQQNQKQMVMMIIKDKHGETTK